MGNKQLNINCVEMKHKAAEIINKKTAKMNRKEELEYWKSKTIHPTKKQQKKA